MLQLRPLPILLCHDAVTCGIARPEDRQHLIIRAEISGPARGRSVLNRVQSPEGGGATPAILSASSGMVLGLVVSRQLTLVVMSVSACRRVEKMTIQEDIEQFLTLFSCSTLARSSICARRFVRRQLSRTAAAIGNQVEATTPAIARQVRCFVAAICVSRFNSRRVRELRLQRGPGAPQSMRATQSPKIRRPAYGRGHAGIETRELGKLLDAILILNEDLDAATCCTGRHGGGVPGDQHDIACYADIDLANAGSCTRALPADPRVMPGHPVWDCYMQPCRTR